MDDNAPPSPREDAHPPDSPPDAPDSPHSEDIPESTNSKTCISDTQHDLDKLPDAAPPVPEIVAPRPSLVKRVSTTSTTVSAFTDGDANTPVEFYGVALVSFDHAVGPMISYTYPPELKDDAELAATLPFLALPDGAHMHTEDYSCFHLYIPSVSSSTIFGVSCNRQLASEELINKSADVTRSTVQKALVVLANKPVFGPLRDKLGVITRAFFAQKDFDETDILVKFYASLEHAMVDDENMAESSIYMGTTLRELVYKFRLNTLCLLKCLMLQKKIMFFGQSVEKLCTFQYSLVSLIPLLLPNMQDSASPVLDLRAKMQTKPSSLRTSDKRSLLRYLGLPLNIFGLHSFFQPYLPLQQLELLQTDSYLVGTTNSIFQQQRDCHIDVLVNIDTNTIEYQDSKLSSVVNLTPADRKWMDELVKIIDSSWDPKDPQRPSGMGFLGSDDWIRNKFEEYVCAALAAVKFEAFNRRKNSQVLITDTSDLGCFNDAWINAFRQTPAFTIWDANTDEVIFDLVEPKHPCEGQSNVISDVGIRLANGLHDLHLDEKLAPGAEAIQKSLSQGSEGVWRVFGAVKGEVEKRAREVREKTAKDPAAARKKLDTVDEGDKKIDTTKSPVSATVMAGVEGATNLAAGFGSFLSRQKSQIFDRSPVSPPGTTSPNMPPLPSSPPMTSPSLGGLASPSLGSFLSNAGGFFSRKRAPSAGSSTLSPILPSASPAKDVTVLPEEQKSPTSPVAEKTIEIIHTEDPAPLKGLEISEELVDDSISQSSKSTVDEEVQTPDEDEMKEVSLDDIPNEMDATPKKKRNKKKKKQDI